VTGDADRFHIHGRHRRPTEVPEGEDRDEWWGDLLGHVNEHIGAAADQRRGDGLAETE
jgi:hypothetical protein